MSSDEIQVFKSERSFRAFVPALILGTFGVLAALFGDGYIRIVGPLGVLLAIASLAMGATTRLEVGQGYAEIATLFSRRRCMAPASVELRDMTPTSFSSKNVEVLYVIEDRPGGTTVCIPLGAFSEDTTRHLERAVRAAMR